MLLPREPAGPGTYRLPDGSPYVIDIPAGTRIVSSGQYSYTPLSGRVGGVGVGLKNVETGARLHINPLSGEIIYREPDAGLDQIAASIRLAE